MLNPNAVVLLVPVAVYAVLTSFKEWRFWFFGVLGLLAATPYPIVVHDFYYVWHDDYRLYLRARVFTWSYKNFQRFIPDLNDAFHYLVPDELYERADDAVQWLHHRYPHGMPAWVVDSPAPAARLVLFGIALIILLLRARVAAAFAALAGVGLTIFSLAYDRLQDSRTAVSFPYARMFLAVPVLLVWLLMLVKRSRPAIDPPMRRGGWAWVRYLKRWMPAVASVGFMGLLLFAGYTVMKEKQSTLVDDVADAVENGNVARPVELAEAKRIAKAVQKAADAQHISLVLIANDGRKWAYVLPELTTCETLFPDYERRTWRMVEECVPRYDKILVMGNVTAWGRYRQPAPIRISQDPPMAVYDLHGQSVDDFCRVNYIRQRAFDRPPAPPASRPSPAATRPSAVASTGPKNAQ